MTKKISYFTEAGKHSACCKDTIYIREHGDFGFYSLADGMNSAPHSLEGALAIQKAIADFWEENPHAFFETSIPEIKQRLIEIINGVLYNLTKETGILDDYASTLLIVFTSAEAFRWAHIGDGIILQENQYGNRELVSAEHNGINSHYTFTTTSTPLTRYLHMNEGSLSLVKRLLLFTDGALTPIYKDREVTDRGHKLLSLEIHQFHNALKHLNLPDDYSMLEITL